MKITEDVHRVDGVRGANAYLMLSTEGLVVVDTGIPGNAGRIVDLVRTLGHGPGDVGYILLTHSDVDHVGSVAELKRLTGAQVAIHEADAPVLAGEVRQSRSSPMQVALKALTPLMRLEPVAADLRLKDGDRIAGLNVLHVPGHTRGSVVYRREDDGVAFVGDALRSDSKGRLRPPAGIVTLDMDLAMASASEIESRNFSIILTGHGAPVFTG